MQAGSAERTNGGRTKGAQLFSLTQAIKASELLPSRSRFPRAIVGEDLDCRGHFQATAR